jgi:hypothetical protein
MWLDNLTPTLICYSFVVKFSSTLLLDFRLNKIESVPKLYKLGASRYLKVEASHKSSIT